MFGDLIAPAFRNSNADSANWAPKTDHMRQHTVQKVTNPYTRHRIFSTVFGLSGTGVLEMAWQQSCRGARELTGGYPSSSCNGS